MSTEGSSNTGSGKTLGDAIKKYWIAGVVFVVVVLLVVALLLKIGVTNEGNRKQQQLITYYNETENVLSDCLVKTKQSVGLANAQTGALDKVITDAVKGRYTHGSSAQPGQGNPLFSAMVEAYPDPSSLSKSFQEVLVVINGCRTEFKQSQSTLQVAITRFKEWKEGSWTVRNFGGGNYPNSKLRIKVGNHELTGEAAIKQMRTLVVVSGAQKGRETNKIKEENPFEKS